MPNDDELIALLIDMPDTTFAKHKHVLMRGWRLASDGLLYHDTITIRVLAMLDKRASDAERAATRRARKADSIGSHSVVTGESRVTPVVPTREFDTKHQAPSSSNQAPGEPRTPKAPRKRRAAADEPQLVALSQLVAEGVSPQHAADWLTVREKKSLPLTLTAWEGVKEQAAAAGMSIDEAVKAATENGWGGFKKKWLDESAPIGRNGAPNKQLAVEARNDAAADEWLSKTVKTGDYIDAE